MAQNSLYRTGWPQIRDALVSASQVLKLKICTSTPGVSSSSFLLIKTNSSHIRHEFRNKGLFHIRHTLAFSGQKEMPVSDCYSIKSEEMDDQMVIEIIAHEQNSLPQQWLE
jgi:hypothetical protein